MAIKEKHGAKGSMILNHDWYEDSQGVNEYFNNCARLDVDPSDDTFLLMTLENGKYDFRKSRKHDKKVIKISAFALIDLIEKHGERV